MVVIEFCVGRFLCFVPSSSVSFLHAEQRYLTREYKKAICDLSRSHSYRGATEEFNKRYNRNEDAALKVSTYVHDLIACGNELIEAKRKHTTERLVAHGFNPETCEYEHGELPESLRNHLPDMVTVSSSTGVTDLPSDEWDAKNPNQEIPPEYLYVHKKKIKGEDHKYSGEPVDTVTDPNEEEQEGDHQGENNTPTNEYSQPDNDTTKYVRKRRGQRVEIPPDKKQEVIDQYVRWRNEHVSVPASKIRYQWGVELNSSQVVYISPDADLVPKQEKTHVKGGKPERKSKRKSQQEGTDEPVNVSHWDIKVEWDSFGYGLTGMRQDVYRQLLVFLIDNSLIQRYLVFFSDGEKCIYEDINRYFRYWHFEINLDYYHLQHKSSEYLSQAIKHLKVRDPRETPVYYKRGPKKGQVKEWKEIYLSVSYSRVISSILFAGNWKEAILYLRNINPDHVSRPDILNEAIKYIWRKRHYITCTALRKKVGLPNSSNPSESWNNVVVSEPQKGKGKCWREEGSYAKAAIKALFHNGEADEWFYHDSFTFKKDFPTE